MQTASETNAAQADAPADPEQVAITERRKAWKLSGEGELLGLAFSGGGIRSATFSLGVLRELSALKKLHRFDYLSTVSGGSYIGAFLCGLFVPRKAGPLPAGSTNPVITASSAETDPLGSDDAQAAIALLRQSGRYLAPSGTTDYWYAIALLTRNWIGLHLVLGSAIFGSALLGVWSRAIFLRFVGPPPEVWHVSVGPFGYLAAVSLCILLSYGWCYWLTRRDVGSSGGRGIAALIGSIALVSCCAAFAAIFGWNIAYGAVAAIGLGAMALFAIALWRVRRDIRDTSAGSGPSASTEEAWDKQRVILTRRQAQCAEVAVACAAFATVDALAFWLGSIAEPTTFSVSSLITVFLVPIARSLFTRSAAVRSAVQGPYRQLLGKLAVLLAAVVLLALTIGTWSVLAYRATWFYSCPYPKDYACGGGPLGIGAPWHALGAATFIALILIIAIRGTVTFLNLSSLSTFYAGRLRRAYLGAGNPARLAGGKSVERDEPGDELQLVDYYDPKHAGAPIHLINMTLNQTTGGGSNIVQRDRHGRNMVIGPGGITRSRQNASETKVVSFNDGEVERLPLSTWIGTSGAAFSTGLGARTGFGLSTLAGLANVRLGYWWRAGIGKPDHSVQVYLINELLGIFPGTDWQRWYLSDGGHFENSGVYELIRRKLPFVLACDNGQDETYAYEDVANLVRKARIDFGADINFLDSDELDLVLERISDVRKAFGTLSQIGGLEPVQPSAVAALARITYAEGPPGTLVLIKPRLTGDGPTDLIRYKAENTAFPQQSTLNQFFDEVQWESYYTLGRLITRMVMQPGGERWSPGDLKPLGDRATYDAAAMAEAPQ